MRVSEDDGVSGFERTSLPALRRGEPEARHGRRRGHPFRDALRFAVIAVVVLAVSATALVGIAVWQTVGNIGPGIHLAQLPGQTTPDVTAADGEVNLLLVGTDTRTDQGAAFSDPADQDASSGAGQNDVTMLLHISADHKSAAVISFPRDMIISTPDCPDGSGGTISGSDGVMFNSILANGGLPCVVLTVSSLTGVTIPYGAVISFDGVTAMSNAVGGVPVCLATPVVDPYTGLDLPQGEQTLQGDQALAFLRSRHGVGDGSDLGRISNQQVFLSSLMRQITSAGVLGNPVTLFALANAAVKNMQLSDTLTNPTTLVSLALALKNVSLGDIVFVQYPVVTDPDDSNRVIPDDDAAAALNAALVSGQPLSLTGTVGRGAVAGPDDSTPTAAPTDTSTDASTDAPAPTDTSAALPPSVTGQTAAEQTCTQGNN
jgi:LCP family protein required for cell wall assembly